MSFCPFHNQPCSAVHGDGGFSDLFFAYPSTPQQIGEIMQGAIQRLHDMTPAVISSDWRDLEIEGAVVFCTICEAINNTRCVVADITDFNFNVLFELGFAIGLGRRVWPIVQESSDLKHLYQSFDTVTTVGHSTYKNSKQLFDKVRKQSPLGQYISIAHFNSA